MFLNIAIVARQGQSESDVKKVVDKTGAEAIVWDEGKGLRQAHERAWTYLCDAFAHKPDSWSMVIESDAVPGYRFRDCMMASLRSAPGSVVSAYLGGDGPDWYLRSSVVPEHATDWLAGRRVLNGVGLAIRAEEVESMLAWTQACPHPRGEERSKHKRRGTPMVEAIDRWVRQTNRMVAYQHPSQLDHALTKAWWFEAKEQWNSRVGILAEPMSVR